MNDSNFNISKKSVAIIAAIVIALYVILSIADPENTKSVKELLDSAAGQTLVCRLVVLLLCIPVHECAHALSAYKLGDDTPKEQGRITLNPFRHITLTGALLILLVGVGYGKPVMINPYNFPEDKRKKYCALVAVAGPVSNLLMAFLLISLGCIFYRASDNLNIAQFVFTCGYINIGLATFNLLPVPPLDGSKILEPVLPENFYNRFQRNSNVYIIVFLVIVFAVSKFSGTGLLGGVNSWIYDKFITLAVKIFI